MTKYKYYFKKPKSAIAKDIIFWLTAVGVIGIAATSPYFGVNLMRGIEKWRRYKGKRIGDIFSRLRKQGHLQIKEENHQIYISLTEKGKRMAGWLQIDALKIKRPKIWDKKWRIVVFDIAQLKKLHREAFRGKLKELGFVSFQKSIWVHPFDCRDEITLLKDFFALDDKELRLIIAENIGYEEQLRKIFKI